MIGKFESYILEISYGKNTSETYNVFANTKDKCNEVINILKKWDINIDFEYSEPKLKSFTGDLSIMNKSCRTAKEIATEAAPFLLLMIAKANKEWTPMQCKIHDKTVVLL